jgi:hypothetical protein
VFLVPSYREEARIVRQTLLSAALQEHPDRRVVLLIDDPFRFDDPDALAALVAVRNLATSLDMQMTGAAAPFQAAREAFLRRCAEGPLTAREEAAIVAALYRQAADWLEAEAALWECADHTDRFFVDAVLRAPAKAHRDRAESWLARAQAGEPVDRPALQHEHSRLAALFAVSLTSFERKRFANLSHEPNKAMNLNTYIALLGKRYDEREHADGIHLIEATGAAAMLEVPQASYLITLDADSLLMPGYALPSGRRHGGARQRAHRRRPDAVQRRPRPGAGARADGRRDDRHPVPDPSGLHPAPRDVLGRRQRAAAPRRAARHRPSSPTRTASRCAATSRTAPSSRTPSRPST